MDVFDDRKLIPDGEIAQSNVLEKPASRCSGNQIIEFHLQAADDPSEITQQLKNFPVLPITDRKLHLQVEIECL